MVIDVCMSERQDWLGNDPRYVRLLQPRDVSLHAESMSQHAVSGRTGSYERTDQRRRATPTLWRACIMQRARNTRSDLIIMRRGVCVRERQRKEICEFNHFMRAVNVCVSAQRYFRANMRERR